MRAACMLDARLRLLCCKIVLLQLCRAELEPPSKYCQGIEHKISKCLHALIVSVVSRAVAHLWQSASAAVAEISQEAAANASSVASTATLHALEYLPQIANATQKAVRSAQQLAASARSSMEPDVVRSDESGTSWEQCVQHVEHCFQALLRISLREFCIFCLRLAADEALCDRLHAQSSDSRHLRVFAEHLSEETRGAAALLRVQPGTPEYERCCQAATGSVDISFFDGSIPFSDLRVLDVHRSHNTHTADRFSSHCQQVASHGSSRVKGMFVSVLPSCVPAIASRGWHAPKDAPPGFWDAKGQFLATLRATAGDSSGDAAMQFGTYAKDLAAAAQQLPVIVSRHSTSMFDRRFLGGADTPAQASLHEGMYCELAGLVAHALPQGEAACDTWGADAFVGALRAAGGRGSPLCYLCLCRVELGDAVPCAKYSQDGHDSDAEPTLAAALPLHRAAFASEQYTPPLLHSSGEAAVFHAGALTADYVMQTVFTASARDAARHASVSRPPCVDLGTPPPPHTQAQQTDGSQWRQAPLTACAVLQSDHEVALKWSDVRRSASAWRAAALREYASRIAAVCFGSRPSLQPLSPNGVAATWGSPGDTFKSVLAECFQSHADFSRLVGSLAGSQVRSRIKAGGVPRSALLDLQLPTPPPIVRFWKSASLSAPGEEGVGSPSKGASSGDRDARPHTGGVPRKTRSPKPRVNTAAASSAASQRAKGSRTRDVGR